MAHLTRFNIPTFLDSNPGGDVLHPTEAQLDHWVEELNVVVIGLDNIIQFFGFTTATIPVIPMVVVGATPAQLLTHVQLVENARTQVILFQGLVLVEAGGATRGQRHTIKVQQPTFDGGPEHARGFLAQLATYRHLRPGDFQNDETFISWTLACMEGERVNPWRNSLLNRRATLTAQNIPLPTMLTNFRDFQDEFEGKFLDPNEMENAGRALMALMQKNTAREYAQEFDRLAEEAGQTGQPFLLDQFRRNLKDKVQERILRQNFPTLQALQIAAIEWDDTLFQFSKRKKKNYGERPPWAREHQSGPPVTNGTPMDLDTTWVPVRGAHPRRQDGVCYGCGKRGHWKAQCPTRSKKVNDKESNSAEQLSAAMVGVLAAPGLEVEVISGSEDD